MPGKIGRKIKTINFRVFEENAEISNKIFDFIRHENFESKNVEIIFFTIPRINKI